MAVRGIFQGYGLQGVDDKGRVAIPAGLRQTVEANNALVPGGDGLRTLTLAASETQKCLIGYDQAYAHQLQEQIDRRTSETAEPGAAPDYNVGQVNMGVVEKVGFDQSGRFNLQGFLPNFADIDKVAMFLAVGPFFQIWNPKLLLAARGDDVRIRGLVEYLLKERGV